MKANFFVDGFNIYHQLENIPNFRKYKWLDLRALGENLIKEEEELTQVLYFSAYCTWNINKKERHKVYVQALNSRGVQRIKGGFIPVTSTFKKGRNGMLEIIPEDYPEEDLPNYLKFSTFEEKKTDVNIAIKIFDLAYMKSYDHAYILSADSDFVPAVQQTKRRFPDRKFTIVFPPETNIQKKGEIIKACDGSYIILTEDHLSDSQLPEEIYLEAGLTATRPIEWN